jgi:hypothetical protein
MRLQEASNPCSAQIRQMPKPEVPSTIVLALVAYLPHR